MTLFLIMTFIMGMDMQVHADEPIVVVIDPGHGGENLGGQYEEYVEKEINPIVAEAMKQELEKYEGVTVYLTHEEDIDMSIRDRARFAKEKNADFLVCLHFNMSVKHDLFGAEVWVPATGEYYAKGYALAEIYMQEFTELGLYSRGIKTRINDRNKNYYGILRYCTEEGIPAVLVEHCHFDHPNDQPFYQEGEEQWKQFGVLDATAVAKYFGLKSEVLGVDYSSYPVSEISIPSGIVRPDETAPDFCKIEMESINEETGEVTLYYNYSINGGNSYSELFTWPRPEVWNQSQDENKVTITLPFDQEIELRVSAYNGFDKWTESNVIDIPAISDPERLAKEQEQAEKEALRKKQEAYEEVVYEELNEPQKTSVMPVIIIIGLIVVCMIVVSYVMAKKIALLLRGRRRR